MIQCILLLLFYIEHENIIAHLNKMNCVWYSQCFTLSNIVVRNYSFGGNPIMIL